MVDPSGGKSMAKSQSFMQPERSPVFRYGLAVLAVAIALGIKLTLLHFNLPYPLSSSFLVAIAFTFWFGGTGPGVLAVVLSSIAFGYFVVPYQVDYRILLSDGSTRPVYAPARFSTTLPYLIYFIVVACLMSWFSSSRRRAERLLNQARSDLELKVEERTADLRQANQQLREENNERYRVEKALRRSEAYLAEAQRLSHTGSFGWSIGTGEIVWSDETFRIFKDDRSTTPTVELVFQRTHPEDRAFVKQTIERASHDGKELDFEHRLLMPDGFVKHVHVVGHAQRDKSGELEFVGAVMDMTATKEGEEALFKAQGDLAHVSRVTTIGELVASIAHEVNQPLGAIVTNGSACVRLLSRDVPDLDKAREVVGRMIKDGMRASEVIKRIRDLLHKAPSEKTPLNINETVQDVIELIHSDLRGSKVELLTALAADLPPVVGDRIQLQQVILNLILNARDAMSEVYTHPRELLITSRKNKSGELIVAVQDSGKGLDPKDDERIFDPFFTTKAEGMGLGLSISRRIIEDHGGRMWATPNVPQGAVVQFTLPAESESGLWQ